MPIKFLLLGTLLLPCLLSAQRTYELPNGIDRSSIIANQIAVKLTLMSAENGRASSYLIPDIPGMLESKPIRKSQLSARATNSVLDGIFLVQLDGTKDPVEMCNELLRYDQVEYAEVLFREQLFQTPDDPFADPNTGSQGYLDVIKAYDAWDLTTGNDDIVIGIVDTGMDLNHEDIVDKYYANPIETANGIDDDNNGYVDDLTGYDFADGDPNAQADGSQHGTHVGGIAGAMSDNGLGIASVGYNCLVVPLKGFTTSGSISTGVWEGVLYAADNGYDIVNLSWGNFGAPSQFLQDIIDYCVLEKDMVVVAAAGNTPDDLDFYPASYEHVLSVGASTLSDTKWSSGTYSDHIDIMAPGQSIFSTQNGDTYNSDSGSSHAAPQVAGAAGLVKSVFPQYNARQIMEQLRVTTDDIYSVVGNEPYAYKLGKGRLNVQRAVSESVSWSLRVHDFSFDNSFGNHAFYGDTLALSYDLTNYLANLNSPTLGLESDSPYVHIVSTSTEPDSFITMETKSFDNHKIVIDESTPPETEIDIRFVMQEGIYDDFQNITFYTNPNDFDFGNGNMDLKVIGNGSIAFSDMDYSDGSAMSFNGESVMDYAGLMIGTNATDISDNVTNTFSSPVMRNDDFIGQKNMRLLRNEVLPFYGYSEFSSSNGNLWIEQSIIPSEDEAYLIIQYRIVNTSGADLVDLEAGFFGDYNLGNQIDNQSFWDVSLNTLVTKDNSESTFASLGLIATDYHYTAVDMGAFDGNIQDIDDTFTATEKYDLMSGANISEAGIEGAGNDVAGMVSMSFPLIPTNGSVKMAVVLSLADTYEDLSTTVTKAVSTYSNFQNNPTLEETVYICLGEDLTLDPSNGTNFNFYEDPLGLQLIGSSSELIISGISQDTVIFVTNLDGSFESDIKRIDIRPVSDVADFTISADTLYLDSPMLNPVNFTDKSFRALTWQWDFGNGEQSTAQNPIVNFNQAGTYPIELMVESEIGCTDQLTKNLVVAERPPTPEVPAISICRDETIELVHPSGEYLVLNQSGHIEQFGQSLTLGPFGEDSILLIAQKIDGFVSLAQELYVTTDPLTASWEIQPDTLSVENRVLFVYTGSDASSFEWTVNGQVESTSSSLSYPAPTTEIVVELFVENSTCNDLLVQSVSFSASPIPTVDNMTICNGEDAIIFPENGSIFGFYADPQLNDLISKGSSLVINDVTQEQTVYVVGMDNIIPSDTVAMSISVENFTTDINADPPHIDLSLGNTSRFSPTNTSTVSSEWFLNGELVETALEPLLLFDSAGTYEVLLIATSESGCVFQATIAYVVSVVTGVSDPDQELRIYPNPVFDRVYIDSSDEILKYELLDLSGKLIFEEYPGRKNFELSLKTLKQGVYILNLHMSKGTIERKIRVH